MRWLLYMSEVDIYSPRYKKWLDPLHVWGWKLNQFNWYRLGELWSDKIKNTHKYTTVTTLQVFTSLQCRGVVDLWCIASHSTYMQGFMPFQGYTTINLTLIQIFLNKYITLEFCRISTAKTCIPQKNKPNFFYRKIHFYNWSYSLI